jgi:putative glutamine amidotransferase
MPKPLIGLTSSRIHNKDGFPSFAVNETYSRSISTAGGIPILIPLDLTESDLDALLDRVDGIVFTGGYDIDPHKYGGQSHPKVMHIDQSRDETEIHLVKIMADRGMPILGICRGLQVINVAMGGSLYEDLPEQFPGSIQHDNHDKPRDHLSHIVRVENDTLLVQILNNNQVQVNSLHHQGVRRLGNHLRPAAYSPDGLVEAFELPGIPFGLAVQWHPEELQENEAQRRLFQVFVGACQIDSPVLP